MKYIIMIYEDQAPYANAAEGEIQALYERYMRFTGDLRGEGKMLGGNALQPSYTATLVRVKEGRRVTTDGPYAETKEQIGGYYLVDVPNVEEAVAVAERICRLHTWNEVVLEVRPVMDVDVCANRRSVPRGA